MVHAAGILLLSKYKNEIYVLLGKDHYDTFSDFGGKCDLVDCNNPIQTASREMYEETCGTILSITEITKKIAHCEYISTLSFTNKQYFMYILFIPYDKQLPYIYNKVLKYINNIKNLSKFKEKIELKWFILDDILNNKNIKLRNVFQQTINLHKNNILKIAYNYISRNTHI